MTKILKGKSVANSLMKKISEKVKELKAKGVFPTLAIVRLGDNPQDISYERGAVKRAFQLGITVRQFVYDEKISHGVLIFRPLPGHINESEICSALSPAKDVDGITSGSMAGVFMDSDIGFPPCTAEACMEILDHYGYDLEGKRVLVMGRSLVIGKPAAMMAMRKNATVSVCHSRTSNEDLRKLGQNAEIVIAAGGKACMIKSGWLGKDQVIIDVGINVKEDGSLCGDVDFDEVSEIASAITPVPGGVGSVTTAILMKHVAEAAEKQ